MCYILHVSCYLYYKQTSNSPAHIYPGIFKYKRTHLTEKLSVNIPVFLGKSCSKTFLSKFNQLL